MERYTIIQCLEIIKIYYKNNESVRETFRASSILTLNSILEFLTTFHTIPGLELQGLALKVSSILLFRPLAGPPINQINKKIINVNYILIKKISILIVMGIMHIVTIVNGKYKNRKKNI